MKSVGYKKHLVPLQRNQETFIVNITVIIRNIIDIDEINWIFTAKLDYIKEWKDPNLKFRNLHRRADENILSKNDEESIWIPDFVFSNIESQNDIRKTDKKNVFKVVPNREFKFHQESQVILIN